MIIAIESSSPKGSIAVLDRDNLLFSETFLAERGHGAGMFLSLERACRLFTAPDRIVVGLGPGSYSGVRLAIATAIGLSIGTGIEPLGIPSAAAFPSGPSEYLAVGDARRGTFYYTRVREGCCLEGPSLVEEAELRMRLEGFPSLPVYSTAALPGFDRTQVCFPSAEILANLAAREIGIIASGTLEPIYLRPAHITKPEA